MSRSRFLAAVTRANKSRAPAYGTGTSIACHELMDMTGASFPEAHLDAEKMAALALAGHTILGFDVVMPLFSVCHESAAMGCNVNWGGPDAMPESGRPIFQDVNDIRIPADLLMQPGCAVPLKAISILKKTTRRGCRRLWQGVWQLDPGVPLFRRGTFSDGCRGPAGLDNRCDGESTPA